MRLGLRRRLLTLETDDWIPSASVCRCLPFGCVVRHSGQRHCGASARCFQNFVGFEIGLWYEEYFAGTPVLSWFGQVPKKAALGREAVSGQGRNSRGAQGSRSGLLAWAGVVSLAVPLVLACLWEGGECPVGIFTHVDDPLTVLRAPWP